VAVTLLVTATIGLTWALSTRASRAAQLRYAGTLSDTFGIAQAYDPNPAGTSLGAIPLCMAKGGKASITGVVPQGGTGGLQITAFAVRTGTSGSGLGASHRSLSAEGFPAGAVVSTVCAPGAAADELGITVQRTSVGNGQWHDLRVNYESGGERDSTIVPFTLKLCGPAAKTTETCGQPDQP
jgi:hypothetical protein